RRSVTVSPLEIDGDVAGQAVRPGHDLGSELVPQRLQLLPVEIIGLLGEAAERVGPVRIGIVDASASVTAVGGRECHDLQLVMALLGGDANSGVDALDG